MRYSLIALTLLFVGCGDPGVTDSDGQVDQNNNTANPICGNGVLEPGEMCDDGAANSDTAPNACRTNCREAGCGDGVIDTDEQCDSDNLASNSCVGLGYTKGGLSCGDDCQYDVSDCTTCGDGVAEGTDTATVGYETCDGSDLRGMDCVLIGQAQGTLACTSSCGWDISGCIGGGAVCGNGVVEQGEECDDSNTSACDGCGPNCQLERCGNGIVDCGEECDDGNSLNNDACLNTCVLNVCGDGFVRTGVEECDDGNHVLTDACPDGPQGTCQNARCGDGIVWAGVEGCDDGNGINEDLCPDGVNGTCEPAVCGDGFAHVGQETCENCLADCDCTLMGCNGQWESGVCCPDSICEVTRSYAVGTQNCGTCGNHCTMQQVCAGGGCINVY